ncbi:universal stress protein [Thiosulfativibrio zosterae]|uniref:Universal stress protein n=1 Tax=Thiosulfativibrio zosterae TaxID=2675053 RepID=A0A6F8PKQ0_9GAMM|nr:universal stress protein [Thiosulfativibrio zosterae]BBP42627.1 universal stress protein [Thiosulfativibrio zosterae]
MLKHILLVSQDPLQEAGLLDWAFHFAGQQQAKLTILSVLPEIDYSLLEWLKNIRPQDQQAQERLGRQQVFQSWLDQAQSLGLDCDLHIEFGKVYLKTVQLALQKSVDLVIKKIDTPAHAHASLFSSQDQHLLRKCPCPLLLYKAESSLPFNNILASIDVAVEGLDEETYNSNSDTDLNQNILALANHFAQATPNPLSVVHAWNVDGENLVRYWNVDLTSDDLERLNQHVWFGHHLALDRALAFLKQAQPNLKVITPKGEPEVVIPPLIVEAQIDLLVMGTLGRSGLSGVFIGNTAENLLESIQCSVLAIKPKGFISPIQP